MPKAEQGPVIQVAVEESGWGPEEELRTIAERAVAAALAVIRESGGPGPGHTPLTPESELSILFTDDAAVRQLNAAWRGKDRPTNVLSFPQSSGPLLGDIVLAAETVREEAALARKPLKDHMAHLIMHGFLHLIGHDHQADAEAEAMETIEREALARMGIADPYAPARDR